MAFPDRKISDKARSLLHCLTDPVFLVSLCCAKKVMILTASLCRALQTVNKDLVDAVEGVSFVKKTLQSCRATNEWKDADYGTFIAAQNLAYTVDVDLCVPGLTAHQRGRSNVPADNADDYFRQAIWFPYLDAMIEAIESCFTSHSILVNRMVSFIPAQLPDFEWKDVKSSVQLYNTALGNPHEEEIKLQYMQWKDFCSGAQ